ncbi:MAG: hypothetical protein JNK10_14440 [Cyclobacteriaceae bacterium]|nr:hypothetical protein [Cyclobacteriaceae bacterium]
MKLTKEQVLMVRSRVESSGITIPALRDDLVDHLCCVIEVKLDRKRSFDNALHEAVGELAPEGLHEIEFETVFLLNSNKIIVMKKLMYTIGALSSMAFVTGWIFGILHLPAAFELSAYGFLGFALGYMPLYAIDYYKTDIQRALSEKWRFGFGILSAALMGAATIFKINHWPGASLLLVSATAVFTLGYLPFLFFGMYRKSVS